MISENAFVCIYLVSQLTKLVSITGTVASMAGSTHRFVFSFFIRSFFTLLRYLLTLAQNMFNFVYNYIHIGSVIVYGFWTWPKFQLFII